MLVAPLAASQFFTELCAGEDQRSKGGETETVGYLSLCDIAMNKKRGSLTIAIPEGLKTMITQKFSIPIPLRGTGIQNVETTHPGYVYARETPDHDIYFDMVLKEKTHGASYLIGTMSSGWSALEKKVTANAGTAIQICATSVDRNNY